MIVKNEIDLHRNSIEYINEVFKQYKEVNTFFDTVIDPIIHMYPKEDTYDESGKLNGYTDAIFCEIHIYDTSNLTVYKSQRLHDSLNSFSDLCVQQIKIFKDLSTLIKLKGTYKINFFTSLELRKTH